MLEAAAAESVAVMVAIVDVADAMMDVMMAAVMAMER